MPDARPSTAPVFVDPTGRRRRTIRVTAIIGACALLGVGAVLVAALLGAPILPTASLPEPVPAPPPAAGAIPPPPVTVESGAPAEPEPTQSRRPTERPPDAASPPPAVPDPTTTTTTAKGKPGHTPPGRPTDLPTPPGHTR